MFDWSFPMYPHTTNFSKHICGINYSRTQPSSSALRARPTSDKKACQSRSFNSNPVPSRAGLNRHVLSLPNTIGVIGGMSAATTLYFLEKLVGWGEGLPFIVCSDPGLSKELASCEKSFSSYHNSRNRCSKFDHTPIVENLRNKRLFLQRSGAQCIVVPCNLAHMWHGKILEGCPVPVLHVGDCVAHELKEAKLKPVEVGSNLRIGVLAADSILTAGFYQEKLQNQGFEAVVPDKATMDHIVTPAIEAVNKRDMEGARNLLRIALQILLVRAVNTIILASEDLHGLLPPDDPLLKRYINPMDALARATIQWDKSRRKAGPMLE